MRRLVTLTMTGMPLLVRAYPWRLPTLTVTLVPSRTRVEVVRP